MEKIKVLGKYEVLLTNHDNKNQAWFSILTDQAISNAREAFEVDREDYPKKL